MRCIGTEMMENGTADLADMIVEMLYDMLKLVGVKVEWQNQYEYRELNDGEDDRGSQDSYQM